MKRPILAALLAGSFLSPLAAPAFAMQSSHFECRCAHRGHAIAKAAHFLRHKKEIATKTCASCQCGHCSHAAASAPHSQQDKNRIAAKCSAPANNVSNPLARQIVASAKVVAERTGTVGWCYKAVKAALAPFHIDLAGGYAYMAAQQLMQDKRFHVVPQHDLRPGDIMVHGRSDTHPAGHIAVYLGNNAEASDHLQQVILGGTYGKTLVFRLKPKQMKGQQRIALNGSGKKGPHAAASRLRIARAPRRLGSSSTRETLISDAD